MSSENILEVSNIVKDFPGVRALDHVSFNLRKGEVHILVGENGAGKSTLMKILAGAYQADEGQILLRGKEEKITSPKQAQELGIGIIYQEFNLIPYLSVANNIFLGREPESKAPCIIDRKRMHEESRKILEELNAPFDTKVKVHQLGIAQQQLVEVAKALSLNAEILIMDEPTAVLGAEEIKQLFLTIDLLKKKGVSIIYISHRLEEIFTIGDRATVLRDGKIIGTVNISDVKVNDIVKMMVGETVDAIFPRNIVSKKGEAIVRLVNVSKQGLLRNVNLEVRKGEIVGLAGIIGAGRTELAETIIGERSFDTGEIWLFGRQVRRINPARAVSLGVGLVPEDRKVKGLNLNMTIKDNVVMASLGKTFPSGIISAPVEKKVADKYVRELDIVTPSIHRQTKFLSGGNQQKVVIAKWLCSQAQLFIFDEPTRGIDVGAKAEVHRLMDELVNQGAAILMISSELPEVLNMSDRIYVMYRGTLAREFEREQVTQEEVLYYATGSHINEQAGESRL